MRNEHGSLVISLVTCLNHKTTTCIAVMINPNKSNRSVKRTDIIFVVFMYHNWLRLIQNLLNKISFNKIQSFKLLQHFFFQVWKRDAIFSKKNWFYNSMYCINVSAYPCMGIEWSIKLSDIIMYIIANRRINYINRIEEGKPQEHVKHKNWGIDELWSFLYTPWNLSVLIELVSHQQSM